MAISGLHFREMVAIRDILPQRGDVLQIGDANWYGDIEPAAILELTTQQSVRDVVLPVIESADLFEIAKAFYFALFAPKRLDSVDKHGAADAMRLDLNRPLALEQQYDLIVNHGTAEHVFHIAQVFGSMHAWTKNGGLMIHEAPFTGWPDHGFYTLQPTLFYDLAAANGYELLRMTIADVERQVATAITSRRQLHRLVNDGKVPATSFLFVVMRKCGNDEFRIPMQGYYDGQLDAEGVSAWRVAR